MPPGPSKLRSSPTWDARDTRETRGGGMTRPPGMVVGANIFHTTVATEVIVV